MAILVTYDDGNRLEDVLNYVIHLAPMETPLFSGLSKTKAYNTLHQWPEYAGNTTYADNASVEGASFGSATQTVPARLTNITQIFEKVYNVSSTEQWVKGAGVDNMLTFQQKEMLKEIGTDIEHAILRGSKASGNGSTARRLAGLLNYITTNATAVASGTKLTESFFNGMLEMVYSDGPAPVGTIDEVYVGARLKRVISAYTAGQTKNVQANDKRLIFANDVVESDFGMLKLFMHRDMPSTTNSDATALFLSRKRNSIAIGEPVHILSKEEVAQTTHGTKGVIRGELTLEVKAESHQALASGLDTSFN